MAKPQGSGPGQFDLVLPRTPWLGFGLYAGAALFAVMSALAMAMAGFALWRGLAAGTALYVVLAGAILLPVLAALSWQQARNHRRGGLVLVLRPEGLTLPPASASGMPRHVPWRSVARIERQRLRHDLRYHLVLSQGLLGRKNSRIGFDLALTALSPAAFEDALHRIVATAGFALHPAPPGAANRALRGIDAVWTLAPPPPHP
jgi:hypothetical protein